MEEALFDDAPVALCVSTAGWESRYIRVNEAYVRLAGGHKAQLLNAGFSDAGVAVFDEARARRLDLLERTGSYQNEEAQLRHADGRMLSTLISARRTWWQGVACDFETIIDVTERAELQRRREQALLEAALTDDLTGLGNRRAFERALLEMWSAFKASGPGFAAIFIDLNGFKTINDRMGHAAGDGVLEEIGRRLARTTGSPAVAARLGGDEFALLVPGVSRQCMRSALRLNLMLRPLIAPMSRDGRTFTVGASAGVAFAGEVDDLRLLTDLADRRMYGAKSRRLPLAVELG